VLLVLRSAGRTVVVVAAVVGGGDVGGPSVLACCCLVGVAGGLYLGSSGPGRVEKNSNELLEWVFRSVGVE
jgi:hypothetical protein